MVIVMWGPLMVPPGGSASNWHLVSLTPDGFAVSGAGPHRVSESETLGSGGDRSWSGGEAHGWSDLVRGVQR